MNFQNFSVHKSLSIFILFSFLLIALFYNFLPVLPHNTPSGIPLSAPSARHLLGTDDLGMDIYSQLLYGTRVSVFLGLSSALVAGLGGSLLGIIAGYYGGFFEKLILTMIDIVMAIPELPFMILLSAFLGPSIVNIVIAVSLIAWIMPAKIMRSKVLEIKNENYVVLSQFWGGNFWHIFLKHLLPSVFPLMLIAFVHITNRAILAEASLAFLGLSDPISKSWGMVLNRAMSFENIFLTPYWKWWLVSPTIVLIIFVMAASQPARAIEKKLL